MVFYNIELRGYAPIGMLEYWNAGIMGDLVLNNVEGGKIEKWVIGKIPLGREASEVTIRITSLSIPTFQYSTIPLFHVWGRSSGLDKKPLFSINCTISETLN